MTSLILFIQPGAQKFTNLLSKINQLSNILSLKKLDTIDISIVDEMLQEIDSDQPCGPLLEYDPAFLEFNLACAGKPEVQYGGTITPATLPEWKFILPMAKELLARSRDLRVAVPFARALLHMQGIGGLAIGLQLVTQLLDMRWELVHPQLDPDDDNDPMIRINTLSALCDGTALLRDLKDADLLHSRVHGHITLRDIDGATGQAEVAEGAAKMSLGLIDAAFNETDLGELQTLMAALESCGASVAAIESILTDKVGVAQALNMAGLSKLLKHARDFVNERILPRIAVPASAEDAEGESGVDAAAGVVRVARADIADRDDVLRAIDRICSYYEQYEPSSPVPLVLQRARRLVTKSFLEIMEDLASRR
jgi:type VI secretion system protein ImpA